MGQRANYIIKDNNRITLHYNHWRANNIAADLYLGEARFLAFVHECRLAEQLLDEVWIEGCVLIDRTSKQVYFWSLEFPKETSVVEYYLAALSEQWNGWHISVLKNRMYDIENILQTGYIAQQELPKLHLWTKEEVADDRIEAWENAMVIIKEGNDLFVTKTGNLDIEAIIGYGQEIIPMLKEKPAVALPAEDDDTTDTCIVIDIPGRKIFINESSFGLWEQSKDRWTGYTLIMGDFGYIEMLSLASIDTAGLAMPLNKVQERFRNIVRHRDSYDPAELAVKLMQENRDIQFNPDFFDNTQPRKTILEKLKTAFRKMLGLK